MRSLDALQKTASTSRVLNLLSAGDRRGEDSEFRSKPFFQNPTLNQSLIVKHKVRAEEQYCFKARKNVATKIILPFEKSDLRLGGRSFFVGQTGWVDMMKSLTWREGDLGRDTLLLEMLDGLPSLDPFILREYLHRRGFSIASGYFAISEADMVRMQFFVGSQIHKLIDMAFPNGAEMGVGKLSDALLGNSIDERLEPLRPVMRLDIDTFSEGIFCWKGFLYYKWLLGDIIPRLAVVLRELPLVRPKGRLDQYQRTYISEIINRISQKVRFSNSEVVSALNYYDDAYRQLTEHKNPIAFRDFLMKSPSMFLSLGERLGVISHIASFWRYRFSDPGDLRAPWEEIIEIFHDFESSLTSLETGDWTGPEAG